MNYNPSLAVFPPSLVLVCFPQIWQVILVPGGGGVVANDGTEKGKTVITTLCGDNPSLLSVYTIGPVSLYYIEQARAGVSHF